MYNAIWEHSAPKPRVSKCASNLKKYIFLTLMSFGQTGLCSAIKYIHITPFIQQLFSNPNLNVGTGIPY